MVPSSSGTTSLGIGYFQLPRYLPTVMQAGPKPQAVILQATKCSLTGESPLASLNHYQTKWYYV